jgi:hypothetical protein
MILIWVNLLQWRIIDMDEEVKKNFYTMQLEIDLLDTRQRQTCRRIEELEEEIKILKNKKTQPEGIEPSSSV